MSNAARGPVRGIVKFYDANKGFGFISVEGGDVRIGREVGAKHLSVLSKDGLMIMVTFIESSDGKRTASSLQSLRHKGTIKWFNRTKGYGFVLSDAIGQEIFVHATEIDRPDDAIQGINVEFFAVSDKHKDGKYYAHGLKVTGKVAVNA